MQTPRGIQSTTRQRMQRGVIRSKLFTSVGWTGRPCRRLFDCRLLTLRSSAGRQPHARTHTHTLALTLSMPIPYYMAIQNGGAVAKGVFFLLLLLSSAMTSAATVRSLQTCRVYTNWACRWSFARTLGLGYDGSGMMILEPQVFCPSPAKCNNNLWFLATLSLCCLKM